MKIKYKYITGEVTEVEVSEEIGIEIMESRRVEMNQNRKHRSHCYSINAMCYEGMKYASKETPQSILDESVFKEKLNTALESLTEKQRHRLELFVDGLSYREIAELENTTHSKISKSIEQARKK